MTDKLAASVVQTMLRQSLVEEDIDTSDIPEASEDWFKRAKLRMPPTMDHEDRSNVLRLRVLDGQDLTPEEMLYECNRIRQDRRSAAPAERKVKPKATSSRGPAEDLTAILDQEI